MRRNVEKAFVVAKNSQFVLKSATETAIAAAVDVKTVSAITSANAMLQY